MKKPAAAPKVPKDPDRVRVNKSMYKVNGVWSVKLNDKEVVRVFGSQWVFFFALVIFDHVLF